MKTRRLSTILTTACLAAMLVLSVVPVRSEAAPLSEAQLDKIVGAADKSEKVRVVVPELATLLGLPTNQKNTFKVHVFKTADGIFHVFARLNMHNDYLVLKRTTNILTYLHVDADLQLIAAVTETIKTPNPFKALPLPEATKLLDQELAWWANYADTSLPKAPETTTGNKEATH